MLDEVEATSSRVRKINDAVVRRVAMGQWPAVIDRDAHGLSISKIRDAQFGPAAKFGMRRSELSGIVRPAARGLMPFKRFAVERSVTPLRLGLLGALFPRRGLLSSGV